ncbi:MAG: ASKHA domain-containing protein [Capsulimonadaceae bacterium]|nr:ASKHA domain-containing protein [Capsulimonadaceae bacterium]
MKLVVECPNREVTINVRHALAERPLSEILRHEEIALNARCGQKGLCNGCQVDLLEGELITSDTLAPVHVNGSPVTVRGCRTRLAPSGYARIRVSMRSLMSHAPQVVASYRINIARADNPIWRALNSGAPGWIESYSPDGWQTVGYNPHLTERALGVAIDIGTTTVVAQLVELATGAVLQQEGSFNNQIQLGDDVLTRINLCLTDPRALGQLQEAVVRNTIAPLIAEMLRKEGASREDIRCYTVSANTTMLHLLAGVDPGPMGSVPFTPNFLDYTLLTASQIGLDTTQTPVHLMPGLAAYIGADLSSGILASGLFYDDGPSLLIDVGTNGEIILRRGGRLLACATAAGPAFEGSGLSHGIRATNGAISHIKLNAEAHTVQIEQIGSGAATGICGSAYVDFLAYGVRSGLLNSRGRFTAEAARYDDCLIATEYGKAFRVASSQDGNPISISETDIASLLQAKAAVAAGILTLLSRVGVTPQEIQTVYLAGGFGMHIDLQSAIDSGLLPEFAPRQIQVVGNTSLAGSYLALLDVGIIDEMSALRGQTEIIELNLDPDFEDRYIEHLMLPG